MKRPIFANGEFYHIYNRGVEKRVIFQDKGDYFRFIYHLHELNRPESAENYRYKKSSFQLHEVKPREKESSLVNIYAFCLMPNHFHILLSQVADNGISVFMQKLGTGYSMFFNKKYKRVGSLFQGTFKAVHVTNNEYLYYLPHYIHLNPLDLASKNKQKDNLTFLSSYKWSSYMDYMGKKNFPSLLAMEQIREVFSTPDEYTASLNDWVSTKSNLDRDDVFIDSFHEV
ncbi:MAG: hypothetical protein COU90_02365 [Candidatus Ryanbacteria bacterium CG10_big_fil_rev_8_21_14_0_10_43_42]|uniref:Transposase IS200-like domain-containing protein n=1 Tax=Candidatus Ryanbacteria bacterium CG10_big_fil_rev_8_21_14_0_10_43_42 TaxID=1974864 RepID=A0A2M8KXP0_9BACT|nr:MAG: hypothetical protein COU90_02365 [Candidatus Ryanbacteria bacterium CG10_big_fil_rev_8_21_14_0_10_43_42]